MNYNSSFTRPSGSDRSGRKLRSFSTLCNLDAVGLRAHRCSRFGQLMENQMFLLKSPMRKLAIAARWLLSPFSVKKPLV